MKHSFIWQCCYDKVTGSSLQSYVRHHKSKIHIKAVIENPDAHKIHNQGSINQ